MDEYIAYDNRMECELEVVRLKIALRIKTEEHNCLTEDFLALRKSEQEGWKESAIAWEVCASIHETWAKKKDAMYSTRHADFERHATDARRKLTTDQTMTDILDLEGWNGIAKHVDGDDYLIEQMREAIRLKDAAITWIQKRCAGEAMPNWENTPHTGHSRGLILDRTNHALAIQPSPEILQDRDERVAEACANLVNRFISGDGILNDTWVHEIEDAIRSGEWRKYL